MSWSLEDFKSTSLEVGQWCWGTLEGAFNEKQTISQVIVDAVIGMIPLLGDVTAVRDLLAVGIGMSTDPKKRTEILQWVLFVILLFALIPLVGGVIKGVGRLALRVTGDVAKDTELLGEVIRFLNRMGHGDAPKWIKALDVTKYQAQLISKCKDFCENVRVAIQRSLESRVGKLLPDLWRAKIEQVRQGFHAIADLAEQQIPLALKELAAKLHALQNMVYRGELHEIATGGAPRVQREAEAYLEERKVARAIRLGQYAPAECEVNGAIGARIKAIYQPKIDEGWPDVLRTKVTDHPQFPGEPIYATVASFHGEVKAVDATQLAGKTMYRAFGKAADHASETWAGGMFWGLGRVPKDAEEWRESAAVLDEWNANGFVAVLHFPSDLAERMPMLKGWSGTISEQYGRTIKEQYLEGGGEQVFIDLKELTQTINDAGNKIKAGEMVQPIEINGVRVEFRATNWTNVSNVYGYEKSAGTSLGASTRRLGDDEVQTKLSKAAAAAKTDRTEQGSEQ